MATGEIVARHGERDRMTEILPSRTAVRAAVMGAAKSMGSGGRWLAVGVATAFEFAPRVAGASWSAGQQLAYVDPGAGSFILQALVAAMAGIIVTVSVYWRKIKGFLGFGSPPKDPENSPPFDSADD